MFYRLNINSEVLFSHIPKSGCQSLRKSILEYNNEFNEYGDIWFKFKKYVVNDNLPKHELISIVRNPYNRLVSGYCNKILITEIYDVWKSPHKIFNQVRPTFEEFVDIIINNKINDEHFKTQTQLIGKDNIKKSTILKMEDKNNLEKYLYEEIGMRYSHFLDPNYLKKIDLGYYIGDKEYSFFENFISEKKQPHYNNFYNNELLDKVYNYYKDDFINFYYKKDLYL